MKFRFSRKPKPKPPPPSEEEEQTEEEAGEGKDEGNGENLEQLAQDATELAQPIPQQATPPPPPPPESVPPRLRLAQVQATTEAQATPPPTRKPLQTVARRITQTARHDLPLKARRPIYSQAICIITKDVNGVRVGLKSLVVSTTKKDFFRVGDHMFYVDISRAFLVTAKGPYLMYDIDITEPLDKTEVSEIVKHEPILLGDNVHYSPHVNLLLQGEVIKQALQSLGEAGGLNMMTWLIAGICAIMGLFIGLYISPLVHVGTVTTTTTTTTVTATLPVIWRLLKR